jgi:glycolate oxidase FAD binding subunit
MGKLIAGSFGTLAVLSRVTFKVLPRPEAERTVLAVGPDARAALDLLNGAAGGPWDITAGAYLPRAAAARSAVSYVAGAGAGIAAIRLEGARGPVAERATALRAALSPTVATEELHTRNSRAFWAEMRDGRLIASGAALWRLTLPPAAAPMLAEAVAPWPGAQCVFDWAGGLLWLSLPDGDGIADAVKVRALAVEAGGHAVLWRASDGLRARIAVFGDEADSLAALARRIRANFDPAGILNPGRMGPAGAAAR